MRHCAGLLRSAVLRPGPHSRPEFGWHSSGETNFSSPLWTRLTGDGTAPEQQQQLALEGGQLLDLVPERRAPPIRDPESVPFQEIMMSVLGSSQNRVNNPFY